MSNPDGKQLFLGIDLGGSSIKYGWGNSKLGLQYFSKINLNNTKLLTIKKIMLSIFQEAQGETGKKIKAIGLGLPGTLDKQSGTILGINPNLPELTNLNPAEYFFDTIACYCENDANLMTYAEAIITGEKKPVIGVTIGSGIGCGLVINQQIYRGAEGYAMELGHLIVRRKGRKCNCGKSGCLESYVSFSGLRKKIQRLFPQKMINTFSDILNAADEKPQIAKMLDDSITILANCISNMIVLLNPTLVVLGGGAVEIMEYPTEKIIKKILDEIPEIYRKKLIVTKASLKNRSGVYGAILYSEAEYYGGKERILHS